MTGGELSQGGSMDPIFSPDGHSVAFLSDASDLTANPLGRDGSGLNLYIRDLATGTTRLVSATPGGKLSSGEVSSPVFSPDDGSLAYLSTATDLTTNTPDTNPPPDQAMSPGAAGQAVASDMATLPTSVGPATVPSPTLPGVPAIPVVSGAQPVATTPVRAVSIRSLGPAGGPSSPFVGQNVFLTDLKTGATTLISATPGGLLSSGWANAPAFSPDGRYLAFNSDAGDLTSNAFETKPPKVPGVPSGILGMAMSMVSNVFVHDLQTGRTSLATVTTGGLLSDGTSDVLTFSPDSRSLFFTSSALDLTENPPDTSNGPLETYASPPNNLFVRDLAAGTTTLVSATTAGLLSGSDYTSAVLSPDGQTVYFDSDAANLTASDPGGTMNIFAATAPFATPTPTPVPTPTPSPTTPTSTSNPPPSTASGTATKATPTPTPPAPVADPGPTVVSVTPVKGRRGITELVVTFNRALSASTAQNAANYQVSLPGRTVRLGAGHRTATRRARSIPVTAATYEAATDQVFLTLRSKLHPGKTAQLQINGTSGGVASSDGVPLNSPNKTKPGQDSVATLDLADRHR